MNESKIKTNVFWYLGNNYHKNFRVVQPAWNKPFFLTTNIEYAKKYSDYGVYRVILKDAITSEICDFDDYHDTQILHWPERIIEKIRSGKHDLNTIARLLYIVSQNTDPRLKQLKSLSAWQEIVKSFDDVKSPDHTKSKWSKINDYQYLLKMWADIYNKGFSGFTHKEFNNQIIALFNIDCLDKISATKVA